MRIFKASVLLTLVAVAKVVVASKCGCGRPLKKHEIYSTCTSQCPATCETADIDQMCIESCGPAGYQCENGYYRRSDGECVEKFECPKPHEIYSTCTSRCPATCETADNPRMCNKACGAAGYQCESGYYRRNDGACVEKSKCPKKREIYTACTSHCPPTCENADNPPTCILSCGPAGYQCEADYYRRKDGACVQKTEC